MAVPKRRLSRMKRDQRRANHDKVEAPTLVEIEYNGQLVVVPRRIAKALPYLTERELGKLGVEL
ncbi:MAG: 50S ribosomal protein L32 [Sandaracinus sp.]|jgi:ribosomal protein L32|nr:50S ribosomal protein L32 [Sandaracinus sp.]MCB9613839.1 50S ribosomal protein L32 [Sandaracinus sp.]MCU0674328.1 50S ribosomal protein L32 [Myxococcota bacterium]